MSDYEQCGSLSNLDVITLSYYNLSNSSTWASQSTSQVINEWLRGIPANANPNDTHPVASFPNPTTSKSSRTQTTTHSACPSPGIKVIDCGGLSDHDETFGPERDFACNVPKKGKVRVNSNHLVRVVKKEKKPELTKEEKKREKQHQARVGITVIDHGGLSDHDERFGPEADFYRNAPVKGKGRVTSKHLVGIARKEKKPELTREEKKRENKHQARVGINVVDHGGLSDHDETRGPERDFARSAPKKGKVRHLVRVVMKENKPGLKEEKKHQARVGTKVIDHGLSDYDERFGAEADLARSVAVKSKGRVNSNHLVRVVRKEKKPELTKEEKKLEKKHQGRSGGVRVIDHGGLSDHDERLDIEAAVARNAPVKGKVESSQRREVEFPPRRHQHKDLKDTHHEPSRRRTREESNIVDRGSRRRRINHNDYELRA